MQGDIAQRIFIVGCARSGTTLVQAMLSSHPAVYGFPETFYFARARVSANYSGASRSWGNRRQAIYSLQEALTRLQSSDTVPLRVQLLKPEAVDRYFVSSLDKLARRAGKVAWSEKTPGHVHFIDRITAARQDALFVHVLRDGRDVVASLEDLHRKTPVDAGMHTWDLDESISQWNQCVSIAKAHKQDPRHHHLCYEDLVSDPEKTLRNLCQFLLLPFDHQMLNHQEASAQVLGSDAKNAWRRDVMKPIRDTHLQKYEILFNDAQKSDIDSRLLSGGHVASAIAMDEPV